MKSINTLAYVSKLIRCED